MKKIVLVLFFLVNIAISFAQKNQKLFSEKIIGLWTLVSVDNIFPDSSRVHPYGIAPKGLLMFDEQGNYAVQILKAQRPKIISGDKNNCTPEENAAIVKGTNAHFGKYLFDEIAHTITFKIESASFPNWEGTEQERTYTINENQLKYVVTNTTQGGKSAIAEIVWKRL
jgi:hypothetical protein